MDVNREKYRQAYSLTKCRKERKMATEDRNCGKWVFSMVECKRRWEKSGMSWMKRRQDYVDDAAKRRWAKSGMSWIKRASYDDDDDDDNHFDSNDDTDGLLAENMKRRWEKSGVSWIRRRK